MTTAGMIADRIRDEIISGRFASGSQLQETQLAEALDVSRGPLREAMQRLIQEGLLRNERHRGVFVVELDETDVADIYLARRAIECTALETLIHRGENADVLTMLEEIVSDMEEAAEHGRWADVADYDLKFHESLVAATQSRRLIRMFHTLLAETRMCLTELESSYLEWRDLAAEHRALVSAMRRGDRKKVIALLDEHLASAVRDLHASSTNRADDDPTRADRRSRRAPKRRRHVTGKTL